ncbi:MAG: DMT family transporter [Acidimicrobiales bacterium]
MTSSPRTLHTADGSNTGAFAPLDWALVGALSLIWGSSFLWTSIGLDSLDPASIGLLRVILGAGILWLLPSSRRRVARDAWPAIVVVAIAGNAAPAILLPLAQQRVDSSIAGMLIAATPLATLLVSVMMLRRSPGRRHVFGLFVGFVGVGFMAAPNLTGSDAQPLGIALLFLVILGFGVSNNLLVPLQQKYGAAAIIARALAISVLLLMPLGVPSLAGSEPTRASLGAVLLLGIFATGIARTLNTMVVGRNGATRGAIVAYLIPIVAIILGVVFRDEIVGRLELVGTATVLVGAFLVSRAQTPKAVSGKK